MGSRRCFLTSRRTRRHLFFATKGIKAASVCFLYILDLYRLNDAFGVAALMPSGSDLLAVRFFFSQLVQLGNGKQVDLHSLPDILFYMETVSLTRVRTQPAVFLNVTGSKRFSYRESGLHS